jgi:hypothetical protein
MIPNPYFKGSGKTNSYIISIKHIFNYVYGFENRICIEGEILHKILNLNKNDTKI